MSPLVPLLLVAQAAVHVAPPTPEGHVHVAPAGTLKTCPVRPVIPAGLAGWRAMTPVAAGRAPAVIGVGRGARATLLPGDTVTYALPPARAGAAGTSGGVFAFEVARAGTYRVALGGGAWIDVVQGGTALASKAHARGPACSPVRKMVDFDLARGRYLLQVAGSPTPTLGLIVARLG
jgi:hypothetical protein